MLRMRPGILVVDDHAGFRTAVRSMLEAAQFTVVGEAADAAEALRAVDELRPGLVLLDVHLPDGDGFELSRVLALRAAPPVVVLTSSRLISDLKRRVADCPVAGFLAKEALSGPALRSLVG
jgi:two-component system, NarL family, nitrate/nitrite response regulator NarL